MRTIMLDAERSLDKLNAMAIVRNRGLYAILTLRIEGDQVVNAEFTNWDAPEITLRKAALMISRSARQ